ncbi:MAG: hypothetical protein ACOCX4_06345, partial [Planctomycetota bacterium]
TTTPVHPDRPFTEAGWSWRNDEIDAYNAAALALMERESVPVNDLHALVRAGTDTMFVDDMLHLNETGQRACAEAVVAAIEPLLP